MQARFASPVRALTMFAGALISSALPVCKAAAQTTGAPPEWTAPVRVEGVPDGGTLRWPTSVTRGETTFVAANVIVARGNRGVLETTLFRVPGGALPMPPGRRGILFPRLSLGPRGALNMVWGEPPDTTRTTGRISYTVRTIWYAQFDGRRWSAPELVLDGASVQLNLKDDPAVSVTDGRGRVHLFTSSPYARPLHFVRDSSGWRTDTMPSGVAGSLATWGEQSLAVAYMTMDHADRGHPVAMLNIMISRDGGRSWSTPQEVIRAPGTLLRQTMLLAGAGRLHALWVVREPGATGATVLRYASRALDTTADASTSAWTVTSLQLRRAQHIRFTAAMNRCGSLVALSESLVGTATEPALVLDELVWQPGEAADRLEHTRDFLAALGERMGAGITAVGDDFRTVFSVVPEGADLGVTYTATRPACARRMNR